MTMRILACIDGSAYGPRVAELADWAACRSQATIVLLHVLARPDGRADPIDLSGNLTPGLRERLLAEMAAEDAERANLAQQQGRLVLEQASAGLNAAGHARTEMRLRNGGLVESIVALEHEAQLIVIGKRGDHADFTTLELGSHLERIARSVHRPLLVAASRFRPIERCLIAFDGGQSIGNAITHVASRRLFQGLTCELLFVGRDDASHQAALQQAQARLTKAGIAATVLIRPGDPAQVIPAHVEEAGIDLLLVGAFGHSRLRQMIFGSTTLSVIRDCRIPVMLFR